MCGARGKSLKWFPTEKFYGIWTRSQERREKEGVNKRTCVGWCLKYYDKAYKKLFPRFKHFVQFGEMWRVDAFFKKFWKVFGFNASSEILSLHHFYFTVSFSGASSKLRESKRNWSKSQLKKLSIKLDGANSFQSCLWLFWIIDSILSLFNCLQRQLHKKMAPNLFWALTTVN